MNFSLQLLTRKETESKSSNGEGQTESTSLDGETGAYNRQKTTGARDQLQMKCIRIEAFQNSIRPGANKTIDPLKKYSSQSLKVFSCPFLPRTKNKKQDRHFQP